MRASEVDVGVDKSEMAGALGPLKHGLQSTIEELGIGTRRHGLKKTDSTFSTRLRAAHPGEREDNGRNDAQ